MELKIDYDFPGGNIIVENISGDEVSLHQDLRDTGHDWFYWYFRVQGAAGRTVHFQFTRSTAIGVRGPAISLDDGKTWRWLGASAAKDNGFTYAFESGQADVRFSFAMPYLESDFNRFLAMMAGNPFLSTHKLCGTPKGRTAEYVRLGCLNSPPKHRVAVTCRHHCCEMMANYALEGFIQHIATNSSPDAKWLCENAEFFIVPFVDKDGVEDGDQGKGRKPRDHGRDYEGKSLYSTTAAIRKMLPQWSEGAMKLAIDLHCPWICGEHNETIYIVGSDGTQNARQQIEFGKILDSVRKGPLPFVPADYLPFGQSWNTAENYKEGKGFTSWTVELPGIELSASIEIPYANACGQEVNQTSVRLFGEDLAEAVAAYLEKLP